MKKSINFRKNPFCGVFQEAAEILNVKGAHARITVSDGYHKGRRRYVKVVNELIAQRVQEQERNASILEAAAQVQTEVSNGTL